MPPDARDVDTGNFYAQMKAPTRVRDAVDDQIRYKWVETGTLEHYCHVHAFDHMAAVIALQNPPAFGCDGMSAGIRECMNLWGDYDRGSLVDY